ncbi:hypothetical protein HYH03_018757 [Edaphochlamys debaryana]|uniref:Uncharacterized protein n=1 Tax=Edaphochlamys debaryana TaxID=47281 RepID=A0A835XJM5_9CHLO|nr:hypothetical protein HYH03_018757 [Edaphochlamys debaryana]|eukprot:KAG2482315.1 hypothetical protein HYH03_018757 [Edaphochlamys debaryana]
MEQVVSFLYNRSMTEAERKLASASEPKLSHRHAHDAASGPPPPWVLSPDRAASLRAFFRLHVMDGLHHMLQQMRDEEGAWLVGFGKAPWPWAV